MMKQEKVVILGSGESGVGAAILAKKEYASVFISEYSVISEKYKSKLQQFDIDFEEKGHTDEEILSADLIIKSPGIPEKAPVVKAIRNAEIPLISEIEFAARFTNSTIIAITGSNGKTTTTSLIHHVLESAGMEAELVGNIGVSFAESVATKETDVYVVEVSSFQLDDCIDFKPDIAVLTNITPDHLDRYNYDFDLYADAKIKITTNQTGEDSFVYFSDDEVIQNKIKEHKPKSKYYPYSLTTTANQAAYMLDDLLFFNHKEKHEMSIYQLALQGKHNAANSMAAGIVGELMGIRKDLIRQSLQDFQNMEHRMEKVASVRGIEFINDSKATNVNSTWFALESMTKPVVLIAGGVDKGNDYSSLMELMGNKVSALICLGKDNKDLIKAFKNKVDVIEETESMSAAVRMAYYLAKKDQIVLLSPACASFDLFSNYEDRGNQFKQAVREL